MPGHSTGVIRLIFRVYYFAKDFEILYFICQHSSNVSCLVKMSYFLHFVDQ